MRIAILANTFDESGGGAGRIAALTIQGLRDRGHEVRTWGPKAWFLQRNQLGGLARLWHHLHDIQAWQETVAEIQAWQPEVLVTHNLTGCGFGTPKALQKKGIPWVHIVHDVQLIEPSGQIRFHESWSFLHVTWRRLWSNLRLPAFGSPDQVISPTQWLINFYIQWGWFRESQVQVIANPVPEIINRQQHEQARVLYVGRLESDKGFDTVLQAWSQISAPSKKLVCIGDGSLRQQTITDTSIEWLGWQSSEKVLDEMQRASIVIVPSKILENQPTVILEALASGCFVIASNLGGIPETLKYHGGVTGELGGYQVFEPGDAPSLVLALRDALNKIRLLDPVERPSRQSLASYISQLEVVFRSKR